MATNLPLELFHVPPRHIVIIRAPRAEWGRLAEDIVHIDTPELQGTPVLFMEPGESLEALSEDDLRSIGYVKAH